MTVTISPSKFDICLLSGVLFNFACVTANYWPTTPSFDPPHPGSSGMSNIYSDPVRVMGSYPSSSPYYPPNYSYSSRMDPSSYGPAQAPLPPPRSDPYYASNSISGSSSGGGSRYPSPPGPSGYGYSYSAPVVSSYSSSGGYGGYRYPTTSTSIPYYYRPNVNPYAASNQIPYQYWRTPPVSQYDAFDRRGSVYGVPSSAYQTAGGAGYPPPMSPYGPPDYYGPRTAYAKLKSAKPDSKVEGEVRFVQQDNRYVGITGRVIGLVPGAHGLHVHEGVEKVSFGVWMRNNCLTHFVSRRTEPARTSEPTSIR
jgi:hypothetical protein